MILQFLLARLWLARTPFRSIPSVEVREMCSSAQTSYMILLNYFSSKATWDDSILFINKSFFIRLLPETTVTELHTFSSDCTSCDNQSISSLISGDLLVAGFDEGLNSRFDAITGHTRRIIGVMLQPCEENTFTNLPQNLGVGHFLFVARHYA